MFRIYRNSIINIYQTSNKIKFTYKESNGTIGGLVTYREVVTFNNEQEAKHEYDNIIKLLVKESKL